MKTFKEFFNSDSASDHAKRNMETLKNLAENNTKSAKEMFEASAEFLSETFEDLENNAAKLEKTDSQEGKIKQQTQYTQESLKKTFNHVSNMARIATENVMHTLETALSHMHTIYGNNDNSEANSEDKKERRSEHY